MPLSDSSEVRRRRGQGPAVGPPPPTRPATDRATASEHTVRLYLPLVAVPLCLLAGWFELTRALGGHTIAWVYVVEWPLFAAIGSYMWWRLRHPESTSAVPSAGPPADPQSRSGGDRNEFSPSAGPAADPGLDAWQAYLSQLHASDPPGGPPPR